MIKLLRFVSQCIQKNATPMSRPNLHFRTLMHHDAGRPVQKHTSLRTEVKFRNSDNVPPSFELIYRSNLTKYIYVFYPLSIVSLVMMGSAYLYFIFHIQPIASYPMIFTGGLSPIGYKKERELHITYLGYLAMNIFTLFILRRTPLRIWNDAGKREYRMVLIGNMPPFKRYITFKAGDITRKHRYPTNAFQEAKHKHGSRLYNIASVDFRNPMDYQTMMGYTDEVDDSD